MADLDILADEILVNAADNYQRDRSMDRIEVTIDQARGSISVWNNGKGIPIEIHKEHNCYVPELIFGKYPALLMQFMNLFLLQANSSLQATTTTRRRR